MDRWTMNPTVTLRLLAEVNTSAPGVAGRWCINAGSEMTVAVAGVNGGKPIRAVVDLASLALPPGRLVALADHEEHRPIGYWDGFAVDASGLYAVPHLAQAETPAEAATLTDAVRLSALVRNGVPVQASVGIEPSDAGKWEPVKPDEVAKLNGRNYAGAGELPLFILRGGVLFETSLVTFGADPSTGRLAAKNKPKESPVPKAIEVLSKLLARHDAKHHGMIAKCAADDKTEAETDEAVAAADAVEKDSRIATLSANLDTLKAAIEQQGYCVADDYSVSPVEKKQEQESVKHGAAAASRGSKRALTFSSTDSKTVKEGEPANLWEATILVAKAENIKPDFKARAIAVRKYPHLAPDSKTGVVG